MMVKCMYCGKEMKLTDHGVRHEITGFEQKRSRGGANKIELRQETGRVACSACISERKNGVSVNQGSLL